MVPWGVWDHSARHPKWGCPPPSVHICPLPLSERDVRRQSTFSLFHSKFSSNIYRADLSRMEGGDQSSKSIWLFKVDP